MLRAVFEVFELLVEAVTDGVIYPLWMILIGCFSSETGRGRKPA